MLALSRNEGESVLVGDSVRVKVLSIKDGHVNLGFEAPRAVRILREELAARTETAPVRSKDLP